MYFIEKVLTPVLSAMALTLIFAAYGSGFEYIYMFFLATLLVFLIAGSIWSYLVEFYILAKVKVRKPFYKYLSSVILFGLGGIITVSVFPVLQGNFIATEYQPLIYLGLLPALIYYHMNLLVKFVLSRFVN